MNVTKTHTLDTWCWCEGVNAWVYEQTVSSASNKYPEESTLVRVRFEQWNEHGLL